MKTQRIEYIRKFVKKKETFSGQITGELLDTAINSFRIILTQQGWKEEPGDFWICPKTGEKFGIIQAAKICGLLA